MKKIKEQNSSLEADADMAAETSAAESGTKMSRSQVVLLILGLAMVVEMVWLFMNSGVIEGISSRADKLKIYAEALRDDQTILPGDIMDRNGQVIAETTLQEVEYTVEDTEQNETVYTYTGAVTTYTNPEAYSQLIGYTGNRTLDPIAETVDGVIGARDDYRLMAFLDSDYWGDNGLYTAVDIDGRKGQSAVLTIDDGLQMAVYQALSNTMSTSDMGSAVVMDARTGEILSMVSFPAYDFNDLSGAKSQMLADANAAAASSYVVNTEPSYPVTYKNAKTPGSIFKVLMAVALIDHGLENYQVENTDFQVRDWTCYATEFASSDLTVYKGDMLDIETALNISSNVFFAKAALELGADAIQETASKFMLLPESFTDEDGDGYDDVTGQTEEEDSTWLASDFGHIQYNWNLDVTEDVLAQTGFGQGETGLSTVYAAMIAQAIANDGEMMQPYLIQSLVDANGKTVYEGEPTVLSEATSKSTANKVTEMLRSTAVECCEEYGLWDIKEVFDQYEVAGKTGTAQTGVSSGPDNAWYISFAPASDPQYVVVVNQCKTNKYGYCMMNAVADIYTYLFEGSQGE